MARIEGDDSEFIGLKALQWKPLFSDVCGGSNWKDNWFLDGVDAVVENDIDKMTINATSGFAVLWTNMVFSGDVKIEYDFMRGDCINSGVNIIYIQAAGINSPGYESDITAWSDKRSQSNMSDYYAHMHTYHISYAADKTDYVRGRRYNPSTYWFIPDFFKIIGTEMQGELHHVGIFNDPDTWIHVTIIKRDLDVFVQFQHPEKNVFCHMVNSNAPPILGGRIGLRLMKHRISHFKNFEVSGL
jgi:hypothetical protein